MKKILTIFFILTFSLYSNTQFNSNISSYAPNKQTFELTDFIISGDAFFLRIENIEVIHQIEVQNIRDFFDIRVSSECLIYNYGNEVELKMFLISSWFKKHTDSFELRVNENPYAYELDNFTWTPDYLENEGHLLDGSFFATFNLTFPQDSLTNITYLLDGNLQINEDTDDIHFVYNLKSADVWTGTIKETVEYQITGVQPDHFSNTSAVFNKECKINYIPDGLSYKYRWYSTEPILDDDIKIVYYTNRIISWPSLGVLIFFVVIIVLRRRRKIEI